MTKRKPRVFLTKPEYASEANGYACEIIDVLVRYPNGTLTEGKLFRETYINPVYKDQYQEAFDSLVYKGIIEV